MFLCAFFFLMSYYSYCYCCYCSVCLARVLLLSTLVVRVMLVLTILIVLLIGGLSFVVCVVTSYDVATLYVYTRIVVFAVVVYDDR